MKKTIVLGIVFLLIGVSVVSSTDNIVEDAETNYYSLESIIESKEILSRSDIAYGYIADSGSSGLPEGPCYFYLDDPGNVYSLAPTESTYFLTGGTWTTEEIWYGCEYNTGNLWTINPNNGDMTNIGGGGTSCNGLSWDPINDILYGASSTHLIEYDPETGEQEFIGSYGVSNTIVGIAINSVGVCFAWDVLFSGNSHMFTIDLETGEATEYCDLGMNLIGPSDGHFDFDTDILYITTPDQLYNGTLIGDFGCDITCLTIPYDTIPPVTIHALDPPEPDGENGWYVSDVIVTLNATDYASGVKEIKYRVDGGSIQTIYGDTGTFTLNQYDEGHEVDIEYWAIDNAGHEEKPHNFFIINIDQTKPFIQLFYEIFEGNPTDSWLICFTAVCYEATSGMERVEFFLNDELQETVYSPGPEYQWDYIYYGNMSIEIRADSYDWAGNMASDHADPKDKVETNPLILRLLERFPLFQRLLDVCWVFIE
jgi:hypothetical protein